MLLNPYRFGASWQIVDAWVENINSTPWGGYTCRLRVDRSLIADSATTLIRLTLKAHASDGGASATKVYVGVAADAGNEYDFDGAPVEVTFSTSSGFFLAPGASIVSDEIALALDGTRDLLITMQTASGQPGDFSGYVDRTGWRCWYKAGSDASTEDATGYSNNAVDAVGTVKIEVR
jgi:hypothetical protein